jgi:hypothetical protein
MPRAPPAAAFHILAKFQVFGGAPPFLAVPRLAIQAVPARAALIRCASHCCTWLSEWVGKSDCARLRTRCGLPHGHRPGGCDDCPLLWCHVAADSPCESSSITLA